MMNNVKTIVENTLVPHTAFANATTQLEQCFLYAENAIEPICIPILGESRTGKSRSLENFMMEHEKSRSENGAIIPVFAVRTPAKPTVKGLAGMMLRALGDPRFDSGTEQWKTHRLQQLMSECGTRMVIIDEFQHFVDKGSAKISYHVADWLKILIDESKVALVVAGLPSCIQVLESNEQLGGRFLAPIMMPRFDWRNEEHREEFIAILDAFENSLSSHFDFPQFTSDEMAFRLHCASGGLIGYLAKILRTAVWQAVDGAKKIISIADLQVAFHKSVLTNSLNSGVPDPFASNFSVQPTSEILDCFAKLGTRTEQATNRRVTPRRKKVNE